MKIDLDLVKKLRTTKPWSQEQLSDACGLSLRTIQRLENSGKASIDSVRALAEVFEVDPNELVLSEKDEHLTPLVAVHNGFFQFSDFSGTATRFEYWWFFLFVLLISAIAAIINTQFLQMVSVILLIPFLAVGTRRLHDIGRSGWWQLLFLVPFGFVAVLFMFGIESKIDM